MTRCAKSVSESAQAVDGHYDVIVIGSGAGGSTLAWRLASAGVRVLVIERGDYLPREPENWSSEQVFIKNRYKTDERWLDGDERPFRPATHYQVGGNTKLYGAALFRLRERDFERTVLPDGTSPEWPIGYTDLAPYYLEAERLYQVHGLRGSDPTDPPCDADYAHPAVKHEPIIQDLVDGLLRAGHKPFPLPLALRLDEERPETSPCVKCEFCDGFPCPLHAKADAEVICLEPALATGKATLLTNAYVERLETSASGREVTAVHVTRGDEKFECRANIVVVSAGAINSAALLLRSVADSHPLGIANRSGVVGRHYMCHISSAVLALMPARSNVRFQKTVGLNDFYGSDGHIQLLGKTDANQLAGDAPIWAPRSAFAELARHSIDFWLMSEDLPDPDNRVTIGPDGTIRLKYTPNNLEAHGRLRRKFEKALNSAAGPTILPRRAYLGHRIPLSGVAHQNGTVRFGADPNTSALDRNCRAHDVDNLYVVDGSFFVSSGAVNPTLTIIANALRVGDVITERLQ